MPHVVLVALSGFRIREQEMLALGMQLPGLAPRAQAIAALPALGLLTLAGMTPPHWGVSYHEAPAANDELIHDLLLARPSLVAISALTASILEAYSLADRLRHEGLRVILGGLHVTSCPEEASRHADAIVIGDGEPVWPQVLRDAEAGGRGLQPQYRPTAPFDLRDAPLPRFDLLGTRERPRYTLQTARGCPLACEFCGASRLLGPFREKPVERIEAELAAITALKPHATVELADDNTFAGRRSAPELLSCLQRSGIRYFTEADWRIGERPDVLEHLAASGCVQVLMGIESLTHDFTGLGAKRAPVPRIMDAVHRIQEAGVAVIGCFVAGADTDDLASIHAMAEWLVEAPFADVQITMQTPFPGTALRQRLAEQGRLLTDRDWSSYTLFDATYLPARMSVAELEQTARSVCRMVFAAGPTDARMQRRREIWARRYGPADHRAVLGPGGSTHDAA